MKAAIHRAPPGLKSKFLVEETIVEPPQGIDIETVWNGFLRKRELYFADPSIIEPIQYTKDEIIVARYKADTAGFFSMASVGRPNYSCSMAGVFKNSKNNHPIKSKIDLRGAVTTKLGKVSKGAHVWMALMVLGSPPTPNHKTVDHFNQDPSDNYWFNVRWATSTQQNYNRDYSSTVKRGKPIVKRLASTGQEIMTYFREPDACLDMGIRPGTIWNAISRTNGLLGEYIWEYSNNAIVRNGVTEEIRAISYGETVIHVTSYGRVYGKNTGWWYGATLPCNGYKKCLFGKHSAKKKVHLIHVLVAYAFLGPKPSPRHVVDHIDGNKRNNAISNLRYLTPSENVLAGIAQREKKKDPTGVVVKPIVQLTKTGQFVKEFYGPYDAYAQHGYHRGAIRDVADRKQNYRSHKGFIWVWSIEYFSETLNN